jgi:arylsulfatase A-like enzyme
MRTPFLISWPARLAKGATYDQPVISLDVFATAVALTGAKVPAANKPEGVNLIPFLTGEKKGAPHEHLFWRTTRGIWAVRGGDWKLLDMGAGPQLFNLATDIGESQDVSASNPKAVASLKQAYDAWNQGNIPAIFESPGGGAQKKAAATKAKKK